MSLIELSLRRRVTVTMGAVALVVFGIVAFTRLPINLLPNISYPSLTVETRYPGAAPAEIESLMSRPIEEAVGVVAGGGKRKRVSPAGAFLRKPQVCLGGEPGFHLDHQLRVAMRAGI